MNGAAAAEPPADGAFWFDGYFGEVPVRFQGKSFDELNQQCMVYLKRSRASSSVTKIQVGHSAYTEEYKTFWAFYPKAICAAVALNARHFESAGVLIDGMVGKLPFRIESFPGQNVQKLIDQYLPPLMDGAKQRDLSLKTTYGGMGGDYPNLYTKSIQAVLLYNLKNLAEPKADEFVVLGEVNNLPVTFRGTTGRELKAQCEDFMNRSKQNTESVSRVLLNGQDYEEAFGLFTRWSAADVCMAVYRLFPNGSAESAE